MKSHRYSRLTIFFTLAISILALAGLNSFTAPASSPLVNDILAETNQFRSSNKLTSLALNDQLNELAQQHSEDMANGRVSFGHGGFDKRNKLALQYITTVKSFAENVAYGAKTAAEVVELWKNSPGHRRNMLGKYTYIGIGVAKGKNGLLYYTQVFAG